MSGIPEYFEIHPQHNPHIQSDETGFDIFLWDIPNRLLPQQRDNKTQQNTPHMNSGLPSLGLGQLYSFRIGTPQKPIGIGQIHKESIEYFQESWKKIQEDTIRMKFAGFALGISRPHN